MHALTVAPGRENSMRVETLADPEPAGGELLVEGLLLGVCGTDREIVSGAHGAAPPGRERLVLGHESLGRVREAPPGSGFAPGDLVAGVVRRPDPEPCGACARGQFDMCRNGRYTERGIKELDGFGSTAWTVDPAYAVRVDPALERVGVLTEPASVVAKAWEQVTRIGERAWFEPRSVLVTGAGPIGLLAALLGRQRGLEVHVLDQVERGAKPELVRLLGAAYHSADAAEVLRRVRPDVVIEATGAPAVAFEAMIGLEAYGVLCLTGVSPGRTLRLDAGALNRELVLENSAVVGSVNANRTHFADAAGALAAADREWLDRVITRRLPLDRFAEAFEPDPEGVKTVLELTPRG
ncbi:glucose 1-dehydrogenase [Streptomyces sp. TRM 70351]|uniref:glucose 1-dehydrogenase n=1 Tax=Streptomyces sp. TRM 70351 TaxID=3116552 RepID=UPI002E7AAF0E|nr:glucose 1-dehydrogenase [Streptomyces sp. TRM 70351]MEE1928971.1 glucose 1-dehydrogenase [Streptomyces sp. TRM 70351]